MTEGFAGYYQADELPHPQLDRQFYEGVTTRRLVSWIFDTVLIGIISVIISIFTLGILFWFFPLVVTVVSFFYRWNSISQRSATPGMRMTGIEFRDRLGQKFSSGQALAHTFLFTVCITSVIGQIVSIVLMLTTPKGQGLPDMLLGSTAINRPV